MRHRHGYRKLGRTSAHRAALLKNLTIALIENGKIETTVPKAKELRSYVEKLITTAGKGDANAVITSYSIHYTKLYEDLQTALGHLRLVQTSLRCRS